MKIGLFGSIGEKLGRELNHDAAALLTVADLRRSLADAYPSAADELTSARLRACIADRIVSDDSSIADVDRVEFFPPLSGG